MAPTEVLEERPGPSCSVREYVFYVFFQISENMTFHEEVGGRRAVFEKTCETTQKT